MSVWGKIIGGSAGFALGGPLGAILGLAAGHGVDKASIQNLKKRKNFNDLDNENREQVFATGVIAISAKLAKADGVVTNDEILKFKQIFEFSKDDEKVIARIFDQAKKDSEGYQVYAEQLYEVFQNNKKILENIIQSLFAIALADGLFHAKEEKVIKEISNIFRLKVEDYENIKNLFEDTNKHNNNLERYYKLLEVNKEDHFDDITKKYKKLVKEYHPDKMQGIGLPKEFIELANTKLASINMAYEKIKSARK
tara:strand:+ start:5171 stop:5929 length:759 start_codon:yes stop_codon:yes gene_type:complete